MRHRAKARQLSRTASHRKALLANLATSLIKHDRIVTTEANAKELRPFATRLDLRHWVQTRRCRTVPSTTARTRCRLGYQRRLVLLFAWLMLCPVMGPLPQISHTRAIRLYPIEHERHSEAGRKAAETYSRPRGTATPPDGARHGSHRPRRVVPGGAAAGEGLRGRGRRAAHVA